MGNNKLLRKGATARLPSGHVVIVRGLGAETVALSYVHGAGPAGSGVDLTVNREWFQKYAEAA